MSSTNRSDQCVELKFSPVTTWSGTCASALKLDSSLRWEGYGGPCVIMSGQVEKTRKWASDVSIACPACVSVQSERGRVQRRLFLFWALKRGIEYDVARRRPESSTEMQASPGMNMHQTPPDSNRCSPHMPQVGFRRCCHPPGCQSCFFISWPLVWRLAADLQ